MPATPPPPRSVLIVDDEKEVRSVLADVFELNGFTVLTAEHAADAVATAFAHFPGVIVLDMHLPHQDGLVVAAALGRESLTRHIPIIAISGDVAMHDRAIAAGCCTYFLKPISPMALVEEALHQLQHARPAAS